jgi:hypothetical protein
VSASSLACLKLPVEVAPGAPLAEPQVAAELGSGEEYDEDEGDEGEDPSRDLSCLLDVRDGVSPPSGG